MKVVETKTEVVKIPGWRCPQCGAHFPKNSLLHGPKHHTYALFCSKACVEVYMAEVRA